jgi:hypothetical protein
MSSIKWISVAFLGSLGFSTGLSQGKKFNGGSFKFLECSQTAKGGGKSTVDTQAMINLIVNKDRKIIAVEGTISNQSTTVGGDFVHSFSSLSAGVESVDGDDSLGTVFKLKNGKESINAEGDIQPGGKFTEFRFGGRGDNSGGGDSTGNAAVFVIGGKNIIVKNCILSNKSILSI